MAKNLGKSDLQKMDFKEIIRLQMIRLETGKQRHATGFTLSIKTFEEIMRRLNNYMAMEETNKELN